ncbi:FecR family protein [Pseudoduganella flava]|nr:FecR family protein [Pseudoduganella flava]TWI48413.1 FecR family protein [Pseudoduganella flava]
MSQLLNLSAWRRARGVIAGAAVLALCAGSAYAGEAGRVVFVSGDASNGRARVSLNDVISEGDELATGTDGYIYLKTIDDGLLILRPATRARIVTYHVDTVNPANTQVKLELLSGVARSVSGKAVKQARQNFRFNTPVAAIGVRGTDFTVYTDQDVSNVAVLSGAIVMSGFAGACQPSGTGPCEHDASRELAAGQAGQVLQVRKGQAVPRMMSGVSVSPDTAAPPRNDEPVKVSVETSLDPVKSSALLQEGLVVRPTVVPPATIGPSDPVVVAQPPLPPAELTWGRWADIGTRAATIDTAAAAASGAERIGSNSYYALYRSTGGQVPMPQEGTAGFALRSAEAVVYNSTAMTETFAKVENGQLSVDFGKRTFTTSLDLVHKNTTYALQANGTVTPTGLLNGGPQFINNTNMAVTGALGGENNAAYIFSGRLDSKQTVNGVTHWTR